MTARTQIEVNSTPATDRVDSVPRSDRFRFLRPAAFRLIWKDRGDRGGAITFDLSQLSP